MSKPIKAKHEIVTHLEGEMLRLVRARGGLSRVELARELKLAPSTAGVYVDRLIKDGILRESGPSSRAAGRPPTLLQPNPDAGRFIGVDLEARNLLATVVDFSQRPLRQIHKGIRKTDSAKQIVGKIDQAVQELIAKDPRPILGIGLGVPGEIDPIAKVALHYPAIREWRHVPLGPHLSNRFGAPVFLENNIRSMALAEMWFGAGRGVRHFICVGVRSGIAAGAVVNGQLLHGAHHQAGEIGHWACGAPMPLSSRPRRGRGASGNPTNAARLEEVASLSAMVGAAERAVADGRKTVLAAIRRPMVIDDLIDAMRQGDAWAASLLRAVARVHGWVVYQLKELFDPEKIIFAGPLTGLGELYLAPVRQSAREWSGAGLAIEIENSTLGPYSGTIGAAALALHQWKPQR
jgi:glucokinase